jgi:WD40 repeat protein
LTWLCSLLVLLALAVPASADSLNLATRLPTGGTVRCLAFTLDGKTLVAGSDSDISLWETATWKLRTVLPHAATSCALSGDGEVLAASSPDENNVSLFQVSSGQRRLTLKCGGTRINTVALTPDGKLVVAGKDRGLQVWDARTGSELPKLEGYKYGVSCLAFSRDGKLLAAGSDVGETTLWDMTSGKRLASLPHAHPIHCVALSANGKALACAGGPSIKLWAVETRRERLEIAVRLPFSGYQIAINGDGTRLAAASQSSAVMLWDALNGKEIATARQRKEACFSIAFSPNGELLAAGLRKTIKVWKLANGNR